MALSFEIVGVEYDFPMLELRAEIDGNRQVSICCYHVAYINCSPILGNVEEICFDEVPDSLRNSPDIFLDVGSIKNCAALTFISKGNVVAQIICNGVSGISSPKYKYKRIAFNISSVLSNGDVEKYFSWKFGDVERYSW